MHEHALNIPLTWKKPKMIFVNSMSDLFHEDVTFDFIQKTFKIMQKANWHTFQVLTKRSERLLIESKRLFWPDNVWMGISVENTEYQFRIDHLRKTEAKVKFISFEPLLGPISSVDLSGIDWVIVGGESGPGARPIKEEWVLDIRDICVSQNIPFFFKQWGGVRKKENGRRLQGRTWDQVPSQPYMNTASQPL